MLVFSMIGLCTSLVCLLSFQYRLEVSVLPLKDNHMTFAVCLLRLSWRSFRRVSSNVVIPASLGPLAAPCPGHSIHHAADVSAHELRLQENCRKAVGRGVGCGPITSSSGTNSDSFRGTQIVGFEWAKSVLSTQVSQLEARTFVLNAAQYPASYFFWESKQVD